MIKLFVELKIHLDEIYLWNWPFFQSIFCYCCFTFHCRSIGCDLFPTITICFSNGSTQCIRYSMNSILLTNEKIISLDRHFLLFRILSDDFLSFRNAESFRKVCSQSGKLQFYLFFSRDFSFDYNSLLTKQNSNLT